MKKKIEPTDTVGSVFTTRRDLVQCVKAAIAGSGFTLEQSDLLVSLYGIRELGWDDLPHDADGYATFKELELFLVHSATLLSRRIRKLAATKPQLVEVAGPAPGSGWHFNSRRARITTEGSRRIRPVWERYARMSANLLQGISPRLLEAHHRVNEEISARIRARRQGALDFLTNP